MKKERYTSLVPAVEQAALILVCLEKIAASRLTLTEISSNVGIHKSKAYSILNTLRKFGLVEKDDETKTYALGLGLLALSRKVLNNIDLRQVVEPCLERLALRTAATALFGVINEESLVVVARKEGAREVGVTIRIGHRFPLTAGAHGKAIVAFLPDQERQNILRRKRLYFHGRASQLDETRLERELAECRRDGFAYDVGELNHGINAVAAPVLDGAEKVIGSLFLIGTFSGDAIRNYGTMVAEQAGDISETLGFRGPNAPLGDDESF